MIKRILLWTAILTPVAVVGVKIGQWVSIEVEDGDKGVVVYRLELKPKNPQKNPQKNSETPKTPENAQKISGYEPWNKSTRELAKKVNVAHQNVVNFGPCLEGQNESGWYGRHLNGVFAERERNERRGN